MYLSCKLQVASYMLQVAGCRLQVARYAGDIFYCFPINISLDIAVDKPMAIDGRRVDVNV